jgi:hypothetical protein
VLLWDSFLLDGAIAAAAVILTRAFVAEPVADVAPVSPRVFRLSVAALALTLVAGAYLAFTLVHTLHPRGRDEARKFMIASVLPGDYIIDRSDRRIAFVLGSWLLRQEEVPAPIGGELYDGAWGGRSATTGPGRVWLVTQHARDRAMRKSFQELGVGVDRWGRYLGDYAINGLIPDKSSPTFPTALPPGAAPRQCQVGWANQEMLGVVVSRGQPVPLTFPRPDEPAPRTGVVLAIGFPNGETFWPRREVNVRMVDAEFDRDFMVENLGGMQWHAWSTALPQKGPLRLTLETDDPLPRLVCLELSLIRGAPLDGD